MRHAVKVVLAGVAGVALGVGSVALCLASGSQGQVVNGPWHASLLADRTDADPYTRARIAVGGLLALAPSEATYWNATDDSAGAALDRRCDYRVECGQLPARWWSLTAYGADFFLIPNDRGRYSFSHTTVARAPDGRWTVQVSTRPRPGNWLPSGRAGDRGGFALTLRLYDPARAVLERPGSLALPRIVREGCR